jgi:hypothetical protein
MWQKLKLEKPNITIKVISKLNVATMTKSRFEINTIVIKVDNQMVVIQVQVRKNIVEDILFDGGVSVSRPHFGISVRVKPTLPKVGSWSLPGLLKTQSSSSGVKSPRIRVLLMSLERS